jgi:anti-sigma factor RsiW
MNAYTDDLPLDLRLDLLVDGELPEPRRRELLQSLDRQPAQWRTLALRFLQQQTEKQSVRALMAGGNLMPVEITPLLPPARRSIIGRIGWRRITATAAGLLIAVTSVIITLVAVRPSATGPVSQANAEFHTALPGGLVASDHAVPVSVSIVPAAANASIFPNNYGDNRRAAKTTVVVQPDGNGGYMVIPVSMSKATVY